MGRNIFLLFCFPLLLFAQKEQTVINIINGSFEGEPSCCKAPDGWRNCGHVTESPPDIQPALDNDDTPLFKVTKKAQNGNTYVGMVVRSNETNERIGQRLMSPLMAGTCYQFSIYLAKSERYLSGTKSNSVLLEEYITPVVLRVWGGEAYCNQKELLFETEAISNLDWKKFDLEIKPKFTHTFIELEAYYKTPVLFPYNGNLLVDNMSHIIAIPCPDTKEYAQYQKDKAAKEKNDKKHEVPVVNKQNNGGVANKSKEKETASSEKILKDLEIKKIKVGQTIKIEKLFFKADSTKFQSESMIVLDELFEFLDKNKSVRVEIGGHTNNIPSTNYCDNLSSERAKAVRDYLWQRGIDSSRILSRGYGKRNPIASNSTKEGRSLNQRVEIKILSIEG